MEGLVLIRGSLGLPLDAVSITQKDCEGKRTSSRGMPPAQGMEERRHGQLTSIVSCRVPWIVVMEVVEVLGGLTIYFADIFLGVHSARHER